MYHCEPEFRRHVNTCALLLEPHLGIDLRLVLYGDHVSAPQPISFLDRADGPSALFTVEYALAQLWMSWGVRPTAMLGLSIGEYVAACLSGVLSLEDALAVVAMRGRLVQDLPPGMMLAVPLSATETKTLLDTHSSVSLAVVFGPSSCVVAGPQLAVADLEAELAKRGIPSQRLPVEHAFHSAMMDPILVPFQRGILTRLHSARPPFRIFQM